MKFDKDITKIKRVTFLRQSVQCGNHRCNKRSEKKIKKNVKNVKNVQQIKNVCKRLKKKNVADICHESSYYLRTLSHTCM